MTGAAAGSAVLLADSMHCVAVLAEETKPVSTGTEVLVEDHDCASRFRLDPTHSLLLRRHLGRNLITLFSTVNTPREKKTAAQLRDAPCERWIDVRTSDARTSKAAAAVEALETKHLFSSGFIPGMIANRVTMELASAVDTARGERIRACECIASIISSEGDFFAPHKPDCAKVRELSEAFCTVEDASLGQRCDLDRIDMR